MCFSIHLDFTEYEIKESPGAFCVNMTPSPSDAINRNMLKDAAAKEAKHKRKQIYAKRVDRIGKQKRNLKDMDSEDEEEKYTGKEVSFFLILYIFVKYVNKHLR